MTTTPDPTTSEQDRVHFLNAYTWAGRRGECAVASEFLNSVHDWSEVTCPDCHAARGSEHE